MKRFGFTLAEVLITLGIIGVVAALTTPALVKNSGKAKIGPSLAKFVNTFETGVEQMMEKEVLSELDSSTLPFLQNYIIMTPYANGTYTMDSFKYGNNAKSSGGESYVFKNGNSSFSYTVSSINYNDAMSAYNQFVEDCNFKAETHQPQDINCNRIPLSAMKTGLNSLKGATIYTLKDGSVLVIQTIDNPVSINNKGAYKGVIAEILYDIDGNKQENKAGKDVFGFLLDKTGILIPAGSNAHKTVGQSGTKYIKNYTGTCNPSSSNLSENLECTGKIADNNYKAD